MEGIRGILRLEKWGWDFREEGWGLRYRLLKVVPCEGKQGHPPLREGEGGWILEKRVGD